ncbi:MAG: type II secretion system protein M [Betaproteobacteria bacterium]|nr:type II secretion system protein M [Betaproteobacteria bacterium]MBK8742488.1 type II secretion system protein M [Betaproteobacteria bacterium]MBK9705018.1 type II secretion system protein M [Betaproteobacteria bacterium]
MRRPDLSSPQAQRSAALALLLAVVLALAALIAIPAYKLHEHYDAALESLQFRFNKLRGVAAQKGEIQKALTAVKGESAARFFLKNSAPNLAGSELQDLVRAAVEKGGARLTSVQVAAPKEEGRYRQIVLNVQVIGNIMTLQKTLHALESGLPYVFVDTLRINSTQFRGARANPGLEPEVTVQLDISAYAPMTGK